MVVWSKIGSLSQVLHAGRQETYISHSILSVFSCSTVGSSVRLAIFCTTIKNRISSLSRAYRKRGHATPLDGEM